LGEAAPYPAVIVPFTREARRVVDAIGAQQMMAARRACFCDPNQDSSVRQRPVAHTEHWEKSRELAV
jgi:hypothetical protein